VGGGREGPDSRWRLFGAYASGSVAVVGGTRLTPSAPVSPQKLHLFAIKFYLYLAEFRVLC